MCSSGSLVPLCSQLFRLWPPGKKPCGQCCQTLQKNLNQGRLAQMGGEELEKLASEFCDQLV